MTGSISMTVGGSIAALAVMLLSFDGAAAVSPATHHVGEIAAGRATPDLPKRARLIRLPDRTREEPARARHRAVPNAVTGLAALIALWTLWHARPRHPLGRTAGTGAHHAGI